MKEIKVITTIVDGLPIPEKSKVEVILEKEIINMNKNVICRGAVGMIFGPVGAILGGMSGIGTKKVVKKKDTLFVISYMSKDGEIKNIIFKVNDPIAKMAAKSFALIVNQKYLKERKENLIGQSIEL